MHGKENYPLQKEKSDLDIELPTFTSDHAYLTLLEKHLPSVVNSFHPDFFFYIAGVDILETDRLGKLSCSMHACRTRDIFVFELAKKHSLPIAVTMGGGYSPQIKTIIEAHCATYRAAMDILT